MQKLILPIFAGALALILIGSNRKKNGSEPLPTAKKPDEVSKEQIRQVMQHLGKKSGVARGRK